MKDTLENEVVEGECGRNPSTISRVVTRQSDEFRKLLHNEFGCCCGNNRTDLGNHLRTGCVVRLINTLGGL